MGIAKQINYGWSREFGEMKESQTRRLQGFVALKEQVRQKTGLYF
jgi:hypothetical protein